MLNKLIHAMQNYGTLLARLALAPLFLSAGIKHALGFAGTVGYMQSKMPGLPVEAVQFLLLGATVFLIVGGISLLLGAGTRFGALLIALFLIFVTPVMHPYAVAAEQISFMKNVGLLSGALMFIAFGPGLISVDAWWAHRASPQVRQPDTLAHDVI